VLEKMERRLGRWKHLYLSKGDLCSYSGWRFGGQKSAQVQSGSSREMLWRYGMERDAFWHKVVETKYGNLWGGWCTGTMRGSYGVSLWKAIRKEWDRFVPFISFRVGDGESVKFWHDKWRGGIPLKVQYPELFSISRDKDASVVALSSFRNGKLHWEIKFSQNVQDWELESMTSFMDLIYSLTLDGNGMDKLCWNGMEQRGFSVQSYYRFLSPSLARFPWKAIWKPKVPS
jgi:hypothetical protein